MNVSCPACDHKFDAKGEPELGTYCPNCGHGFHYT